MASPDAAQQFNLRWNNHTNNIIQVFAEQLCSESLVDVTISCQGKFLKAHKMVLSACSPYFQELFQLHQVAHPVIIINGMSFLDIKLVIEFMYRGEVKVQEDDLGGLLLAAETLQVKGLANVRNKYEKGQIQEKNSFENSPSLENSQKTDCSMETDDKEAPHIRSRRMSSLSTDRNFDDDLPTTIKVEPPDIRDIDEEENNAAGWDSPRLVIDMKESKEAISDRLDLLERKRPNILRQPIQSIRVSKHLEIPDSEGSSSALRESSAKCYLWPKTKPKLVPCWPRTKGKIPRPPNAFMIFANDWRKKLAMKFPVESNKDISIRLGTMWKNLDPDSKEAYYSAARKADEEHKIKYPGYYYSPKEARLRKGIKRGRIIGVPQMDALRFVKVYMTSAEKNNLLAKESTSLLRKLNTNSEDGDESDRKVEEILRKLTTNSGDGDESDKKVEEILRRMTANSGEGDQSDKNVDEPMEQSSLETSSTSQPTSPSPQKSDGNEIKEETIENNEILVDVDNIEVRSASE